MRRAPRLFAPLRRRLTVWCALCGAQINRDELIRSVASLVPRHLGFTVDLKRPQITVQVQVFGRLTGVAVIPDFGSLRDYNLRALLDIPTATNANANAGAAKKTHSASASGSGDGKFAESLISADAAAAAAERAKNARPRAASNIRFANPTAAPAPAPASAAPTPAATAVASVGK